MFEVQAVTDLDVFRVRGVLGSQHFVAPVKIEYLVVSKLSSNPIHGGVEPPHAA